VCFATRVAETVLIGFIYENSNVIENMSTPSVFALVGCQNELSFVFIQFHAKDMLHRHGYLGVGDFCFAREEPTVV